MPGAALPKIYAPGNTLASRTRAPYPKPASIDEELLTALPSHAGFTQGSPSDSSPNAPMRPVVRKISGTYYLDFSPDHVAGGIFRASASSYNGPFTPSDTPVITEADLPSGTGGQLNALTEWIWNDTLEKYVGFPHTVSFSGSPQRTIRLLEDPASLGTITFDNIDGSTPVCITGDGSHFGYIGITKVGGKLIGNHRIEGDEGFLWGQSETLDPEWKQWRPIKGRVRVGHPHPFADSTIGNDWLWLNVPQVFDLGGQWWALSLFRQRAAITDTDRADDLFIYPVADDLWTPTGPAMPFISRSDVGSWGSNSIGPGGIHVEHNRILFYFQGVSSSFVGNVGVAVVEIDDDGSYSSY